jgi:hypothetical protein
MSPIRSLSCLAACQAALAIAGCSASHAPTSSQSTATVDWPQGTPVDQRIGVINNAAALAGRLHVAHRSVGLKMQSAPALHFTGSPANLSPATPVVPTFEWVAQLDPPTAEPDTALPNGDHFESETPVPLYAATVSIQSNVALVTYMLLNDTFGGAIDVLDITDPTSPVLRASAIFDHMNITDATFVPDDANGNGTVYAAAATCDQEYPGTALVERLRLRNFQIDVSADYRVPLFGGSGESVAVQGGKLYGTAGVGGGLRVFDSASGAILGDAPVGDLGDARWVSVAGGLAAVVSGGTRGQLDVFDTGSLARIGSFPFKGANVPQSKSTVALVGERAFIAAGPGGMQVMSVRSGKIVGAVPVPANTGYDPADVVTNAVSIDDDLVFMANGGPGVYVAKSATPLEMADSETAFVPAWVSSIDIQGSVNHVEYRDGTLLVASGTNGLQLIRVQ